jgi:hypothetical protein
VKQVTFLILITVLLLAACGGPEVAESVAEVAAPLEEAASPPATATAAPLPTDTSTPLPEVPTDAPTSAPLEENTQEAPTAETAANPDPTAPVEPTVEVEEPTPLQMISGQTAEGAYFYGDPDAPVTLFDYSDFL